MVHTSGPRLWLTVLVVTTALHMVLAASLPLSGDEAYYWDCSRHLDWSYFDQPPLVIWSMVPFRAVLGETRLAVRMPAIVASLAIGLLLLPLVRRLGGDHREAAVALVVLHLAPGFLLGSFYASTDIAMIACYAAATVAAARVAEGDLDGWWAFSLAIGVGFLAKFPVVLVVGAIAAALRFAAARSHLRRPTPWLAALLSGAVTMPVWIWGALHDWDNIRFQLVGRHTSDPEPLQQLADLVLGVLALLTPFLVAAIFLLVESVCMYVGSNIDWVRQGFGAYARIPTELTLLVGFLLGAAVSWFGWKSVDRRIPQTEAALSR